MRKKKPHGAVVAWVGALSNEQIFISAVTFGEMHSGIERTSLQDPAKAAEIESWMLKLSRLYRVLSMDTQCFLEWGRLKEGKPDRILEDVMIAATGSGARFGCRYPQRERFRAVGSDLQPLHRSLTAAPGTASLFRDELREPALQSLREALCVLRVFRGVIDVPQARIGRIP